MRRLVAGQVNLCGPISIDIAVWKLHWRLLGLTLAWPMMMRAGDLVCWIVHGCQSNNNVWFWLVLHRACHLMPSVLHWCCNTPSIGKRLQSLEERPPQHLISLKVLANLVQVLHRLHQRHLQMSARAKARTKASKGLQCWDNSWGSPGRNCWCRRWCRCKWYGRSSRWRWTAMWRWTRWEWRRRWRPSCRADSGFDCHSSQACQCHPRSQVFRPTKALHSGEEEEFHLCGMRTERALGRRPRMWSVWTQWQVQSIFKLYGNPKGERSWPRPKRPWRCWTSQKGDDRPPQLRLWQHSGISTSSRAISPPFHHDGLQSAQCLFDISSLWNSRLHDHGHCLPTLLLRCRVDCAAGQDLGAFPSQDLQRGQPRAVSVWCWSAYSINHQSMDSKCNRTALFAFWCQCGWDKHSISWQPPTSETFGCSDWFDAASCIFQSFGCFSKTQTSRRSFGSRNHSISTTAQSTSCLVTDFWKRF